MKTARRISVLTAQLNELQAYLGQIKSKQSNGVMEAQRIAAQLAVTLEDWHLEALHIPAYERETYRSVNPYYVTH